MKTESGSQQYDAGICVQEATDSDVSFGNLVTMMTYEPWSFFPNTVHALGQMRKPENSCDSLLAKAVKTSSLHTES
jgi:hypothetical protein